MLFSDYVKEYQHFQNVFAKDKLDCSCQSCSGEMSKNDVLVKYEMYDFMELKVEDRSLNGENS